MTRGIHLKRLTTTNLEALGLKDAHCAQDTGAPAPLLTSATPLAEVDPVLSQLVSEVCEGLEGTLRLLEQALAITVLGDDR